MRCNAQSGFHWTLIRPAASASEVTTVWRYRNSIIIIIIMYRCAIGRSRSEFVDCANQSNVGLPTLDLGIPGLPPFPSPPLPPLLFPSRPSFSFPGAPPPKPARGSGGKLPQWGLGCSPSRQTIWCISEPKGAAPVATVFCAFS